MSIDTYDEVWAISRNKVRTSSLRFGVYTFAGWALRELCGVPYRDAVCIYSGRGRGIVSECFASLNGKVENREMFGLKLHLFWVCIRSWLSSTCNLCIYYVLRFEGHTSVLKAYSWFYTQSSLLVMLRTEPVSHLQGLYLLYYLSTSNSNFWRTLFSQNGKKVTVLFFLALSIIPTLGASPNSLSFHSLTVLQFEKLIPGVGENRIPSV